MECHPEDQHLVLGKVADCYSLNADPVAPETQAGLGGRPEDQNVPRRTRINNTGL